MTTARFYLPSSGAAAVSPAYSTLWDNTASAARLPMSTTPANTSNASNGASEAVSGQIDVLNRQFVGPNDLAAGTITGSFSMAMFISETNLDMNAFLQVVVRVFSSDGATERGVLYAGQSASTSSSNSADPNYEFPTSAASRILSGTFTPVAVQANDRFVVDIGYRANNTATASRSGIFHIGDQNIDTDIAYTVDVAQSSSQRPWFEVVYSYATGIDYTVEVAFNAGWSTAAASRTWTDVTDYVMVNEGIEIIHGRQDERSQADSNQLRLTLKNSDGRFTPGLASSPYYPNVKIGRPIRVTATPPGQSASTRFVGYVDEWPVEWPAVVDTLATSRITATSRTARLGLSAPLSNIVEEEFLADDPVGYWPLSEGEGATSAADLSGNGRASLTSAGSGTAVSFGVDEGPTTDGLTAATFAGGKYLKAQLAISAASTLTISLFIKTTISGSSQVLAHVTQEDGDLPYAGLTMNSDGTIGAFASGATSATSPLAYNDGATHHVAMVVNGTAMTLYVDGASVSSSSWGSPVSLTTTHIYVAGKPAAASIGSGTWAHVAVFTSALSSARISAHSTSGRDGFAAETAEARIDRYASYAGIPTAEISSDSGADTPMAHIDTTGQNVLSLLQKVAETDGGVLYDAKDGTLTYVARSARYNATAAITLDTSASEVEASYAPKLDRTAIINEVVATVADGTGGETSSQVRAIASSSYDDYGPHRLDIELATTDANEAHAAAWWRVNTYGEPAFRAPQLGVEIAHLSAARQALVLALNVGSKITVSNLPSQSDASSKSFFVEGWTETIDAATHRFQFNVSPTTGFDVWKLDDTTYSVLGTTTKLAY